MRRRAALLVGAFLLTGCGVDVDAIAHPDTSERPVDLTAEIVAGTWRNEQRDGTIVFTVDGTFEARNLSPEKLAEYTDLLPPSFDKSRDRIDCRGQWGWVPDPMKVASHNANVDLTLECPLFPTRKVGLTLYGHWYGDTLGLMFFFGDPDLKDAYVYLKSPMTPSPS